MTIAACKLQLIEYISTVVVIQSLSLYPFQTGNSIMERNIILFLDFVHTLRLIPFCSLHVHVRTLALFPALAVSCQTRKTGKGRQFSAAAALADSNVTIKIPPPHYHSSCRLHIKLSIENVQKRVSSIRKKTPQSIQALLSFFLS